MFFSFLIKHSKVLLCKICFECIEIRVVIFWDSKPVEKVDVDTKSLDLVYCVIFLFGPCQLIHCQLLENDNKVDQVSTGEVPNLRSRLTASNKSTPVALNGDNVVQTNEPYESENAASEKTDLASSDFITQYLTRIFCTAVKAKEKAAKKEDLVDKPAEEKATKE